jgi:serine/threonine protein phosphatase PrpC
VVSGLAGAALGAWPLNAATLAGDVSVLVESRRGVHLDSEDRYFSELGVPLYAVLDGEVHEGHAADVGLGVLRDRLALLTAAVASGPERVREELVASVRRINSSVFADATTTRWRGCGTTLTCLALTPEALVVAHVGDSRLYRHDSTGWHCVTADHSLVQDLRRAGSVEDLDEAISRHSTVITRALGFTEQVEVDTFVVPRADVSNVFLCTDGLWRPFDPLLVGASPPNLVGQALLDRVFRAYDNDGQRDNATGLLISI